MNKGTHWFWAHRRNAALHHFSLLIPGLAGKCWLPVVDFTIDHALVVSEPGKGMYVFYDRDELSQKGVYPKVEQSILNNPNFVRNFKRRSDEVFGALHFKTKHIYEANIALCSEAELLQLWRGYRDALTVGPIITVQLWSIEALFDPAGTLMHYLDNRLLEMGDTRSLQNYREGLAINTGETIAYTEQKQLLRVLAVMDTPELVSLFHSTNPHDLKVALADRFPDALSLITTHAHTYGWVHAEYQSNTWSTEKWLLTVKEELLKDIRPMKRLEELQQQFQEHVALRAKLIERLNPPDDIRHLMDGLAELIAERDWTKGYFAQSLTGYHMLLDEIAKRNGLVRTDLFSYTQHEVEALAEHGTKVEEVELHRRRNGRTVLVCEGGEYHLITDPTKVQQYIEQEDIGGPLEKISAEGIIKGLGASKGTIRGKARVLESAGELHTLEDGEILVTYMTTVEFTPAFRRAGGVVTDEGGMACHAAITSREYGIPAVVGTQVATRVIQTGDTIEVDGVKGTVRLLNQ